jgi:hypothetical protein
VVCSPVVAPEVFVVLLGRSCLICGQHRRAIAVVLMFIVVFALAISLALRVLYLHQQLTGLQLVRLRSRLGMSVELRRCAKLARLEGDSMGFPCPREFRVLAVRFVGIPLWRQTTIVGLPAQVEAHISSVPPEEFDHLFRGDFKLQAR